MSDIVFRGKRLDNGEWVEGFYIFDGFSHYICRFYADENAEGTLYPVEELFEVLPGSVGQYTGKADKNGKKIFKGDLLKPFDDEIDKMVVEFHHGSFLLCLYGERGYMGENGWVEEGNYGVFECEPLSSYGDDIEIIGNIHDNPEVLGVSR